MSSFGAPNDANHFFWLASYPKSGNTWFRLFLTSLLSDTDQAFDANSVEHGQHINRRDVLDELIGFDSADLSFAELNNIRNGCLKWVNQHSNSNVYQKTHAAYTYNQKKCPTLGAQSEGVSGALCFIRNPLDVCISYAHHINSSIDYSIKIMGNTLQKSQPLHTKSFIPEDISSWSANVNSWKNSPDIAVLFIRYEDMLNDPVKTFSRACQFLKIEAGLDRIQIALENCSFQSLKTQEAQQPFIEKPLTSKCFFRKGVAGDWQDTLNSEQISQIIDHHGSTMKQFGYIDEQGMPKVS